MDLQNVVKREDEELQATAWRLAIAFCEEHFDPANADDFDLFHKVAARRFWDAIQDTRSAQELSDRRRKEREARLGRLLDRLSVEDRIILRAHFESSGTQIKQT